MKCLEPGQIPTTFSKVFSFSAAILPLEAIEPVETPTAKGRKFSYTYVDFAIDDETRTADSGSSSTRKLCRLTKSFA